MRTIELNNLGIVQLTLIVLVLAGFTTYYVYLWLEDMLYYYKRGWDFSIEREHTMRWGYLTSSANAAHKMGGRARVFFGEPFMAAVFGFLGAMFLFELLKRF